MPKGSPERTHVRREEIINACEKLYRTMSFKEITIKAIGSATSFTRTSIYNYFHNKEEIFLALLEREYELWTCELEELMRANDTMNREAFADALAHSLERRVQLLKIMSMNHYDMEASSRPERLTAFKIAYGHAMKAIRSCLSKFFPDMTSEQIESFIYAFFPFMFGIYPYTSVTEKQSNAMRDAGIPIPQLTVYSITLACARKLLGMR